MNSVKKRKIAAFVTLSVMLVAVVATACILTAPSLYKDEGITPTNPADSLSGGAVSQVD